MLLMAKRLKPIVEYCIPLNKLVASNNSSNISSKLLIKVQSSLDISNVVNFSSCLVVIGNFPLF